MIVEGKISVKAVIAGKRRAVNKLYVDIKKNDRDTAWLLREADNRNIPVERLPRGEIEDLASGKTHGGILADVCERTYQKKEDALAGNPFIALCEGLQDPFNLGHVCRSLYSCGCTGLILDKRDWGESEKTVIKASGGAYELINIIRDDDISGLISFYRSQGVALYAAMRKDASVYDAQDYTCPVLIAFGGEMRGLSSKILAQTDKHIYIPYANGFRNSLNADGAVTVIGFEVFRQRRHTSNC